ncbi:MAG: Bug family tripartite tricarboxylate transporter substrate binding protein [Candidatus Competibacterales bacterium]
MFLPMTLVSAFIALILTHTAFAQPNRPECIAPASPGGGFDLTCKLAQRGLQELDLLPSPMRVTYMPGGIGAVAYNTIVAQRPDDNDTIIAFSGGSLLNLAQGKFGRYDETAVRWLAAIGSDYGMIAVRQDSPYQNLADLIEAIKASPADVVFGSGGTVGSQDWMKSALIFREAGIDLKSMRYVPFEGGGEAQTALLGGHIQAYSGDISEVKGMLEGGQLRVLAVMADEPLPAPFDVVPTAKDQGYDVDWPVIRGFYVGPEVSDEAYQWWQNAFDEMLASPEFDEYREQRGLLPYSLTGDELDTFVKKRVGYYRELAQDFGLVQ